MACPMMNYAAINLLKSVIDKMARFSAYNWKNKDEKVNSTRSRDFAIR